MKAALSRMNPLAIALGASVLLHAVLLTVRFVDPEGFNRVFEDTPLEVILVNAKSDEAPEKAQAIAQSNLAGGGESTGMATSPLPPSAMDSYGNDLQAAQAQIDAMQQQQMALLAQVKQQIAHLPAPDPAHPATTPAEKEQQLKRQQLSRLLAEIDRRIREENARPRKRYISPATMKGVQALYYDTLKQKIEDKGTSNFPEQAGQKLYGQLILMLTVNHDGRVLDATVMQSSGNRTLDRQARAIAISAGPFDKFGKELRHFTDELVIVSRFNFAHNNTLQANFVSTPAAAAALSAPPKLPQANAPAVAPAP